MKESISIDQSQPIHFSELVFTSGTNVQLSPFGLVVLVGPNNAGKSTTLFELMNYASRGVLAHNRPNVSLASVKVSKTAAHDFKTWLNEFRVEPSHNDPPSAHNVYYKHGHTRMSIFEPGLDNELKGDKFPQSITQLLVASNPRAPFESQTPNFYATHSLATVDPILAKLMFDEEARNQIELDSLAIFGTQAQLSSLGSVAAFHFGEIPTISDPPTESEVEALLEVPTLASQGTGVTSLMSQMIALQIGREPIVFCDEPDAHLHPPQARLAGAIFARRAMRSQVLVATHNLHFLLGALDSQAHVTVVRLNRSNPSGLSTVAEISDDSVRLLWQNPVVRYSGLLEGLMHRGVVICEAEADCRYLEMALDADDTREGRPARDLLFVSSNGKAALKKLAEAARQLCIPRTVVADFDLLSNWDDIADLMSSLAVDATPLEASWKVLNGHLAQGGARLSKDQVRVEINRILSEKQGGVIDKAELSEIDALLRPKNGWKQAKISGIATLRGGPRDAALSLMAGLREAGIVVLPIGELESFHPEVSGSRHGPAWLERVTAESLHLTLDSERLALVIDCADVRS